MSFTLNCSSDVLAAIGQEAKTAGISQTRYINSLLEKVVQMPKALTSGTSLDELEAQSMLFGDDVLKEVAAIAQAERRSIDQMLLHLVERALAAKNRQAEHLQKSVRLGSVVPFQKKKSIDDSKEY